MNTRIPPSLVTAEHSYTRSDEPWNLEAYTEASGRTSTGHTYGWKLFHYISGGGMRTFGRTLRQDVRSRRQNQFLTVSAVLGLVWLVLLAF